MLDKEIEAIEARVSGGYDGLNDALAHKDVRTLLRIVRAWDPVVEAAIVIVDAEKASGHPAFEVDCLLDDLRKAVEGIGNTRRR